MPASIQITFGHRTHGCRVASAACDTAGSTTQHPEDRDVDWTDKEQIRRSRWMYGFKTAAKAQLKIACQSFTGIVVVRVGNNRFMRINMFVTILGTLLLWSNISNNLTFLGIALIGFTLGPVLPTLLADTPKRTGLRFSANAVGFQIAAAGIGLALLPGLAAWVAVQVGLESIGAYLFLIALVSFIVHEGLVIHDRRGQQALSAHVVAGD